MPRLFTHCREERFLVNPQGKRRSTSSRTQPCGPHRMSLVLALLPRHGGGFQFGNRMMHARHAPMSFRFFAHGYAASVQLATRRIDRKLVLVPNCIADGMKRTLADVEPGCWLLMKIALAEIPDYLFPAIEFGVD